MMTMKLIIAMAVVPQAIKSDAANLNLQLNKFLLRNQLPVETNQVETWRMVTKPR